jgi:hypothetical protein
MSRQGRPSKYAGRIHSVVALEGLPSLSRVNVLGALGEDEGEGFQATSRSEDELEVAQTMVCLSLGYLSAM